MPPTDGETTKSDKVHFCLCHVMALMFLRPFFLSLPLFSLFSTVEKWNKGASQHTADARAARTRDAAPSLTRDMVVISSAGVMRLKDFLNFRWEEVGVGRGGERGR